MKISSTFYNDAGELMAPHSIDVKLAPMSLGGHPTLDEGFYHLFKFEGRTQREREEKYRRFFTSMNAIPGYMTLSQRAYTVQMDSFVRYGVEVMYVIESSAQAADALRRAQAIAHARAVQANQPKAVNTQLR